MCGVRFGSVWCSGLVGIVMCGGGVVYGVEVVELVCRGGIVVVVVCGGCMVNAVLVMLASSEGVLWLYGV